MRRRTAALVTTSAKVVLCADVMPYRSRLRATTRHTAFWFLCRMSAGFADGGRQARTELNAMALGEKVGLVG